MLKAKSSYADTKYYPETDCRWKTYGNYRLIIWAWMLNEVGVSFAATDIAHNGFYMHDILHLLAVIFIGIPLIYSEICLSQYTNHGVISIWNYLPILRPVGYGTIYLIFLKTIYLMAMASWYLLYTFYSALDPPPWFSCDDFNTTKCMVKRVNVSIFQHCLEAQILFDHDCGVKTASSWFFEREIGDNNTMNSMYCVFAWKGIVATGSISFILLVLSLREEKFIQISVKLLALYVSIVILLLLCVALSTSGAWYATKVSIDWDSYTFDNSCSSITQGFLSVGTGFGIIGFLSRDVPFRSPATMTSIVVPLFSYFVITMYSLIVFSGIKTMSYYHGEEENVIELGANSYFSQFASVSEIMSYLDEIPLWGFAWFSSVFLCLFINLWILYYFLRDLVKSEVSFAQRHTALCNILITILLCVLSWPLLCSDITGSFTDAIEIIQITSSLLFSFSLYWIYGVHNHNVDIIFMIGIKASYFWKITWFINPFLLSFLLYTKFKTLYTKEFNDSLFIEGISISYDEFVIYLLIAIYGCIVIVGIFIELVIYYRKGFIRDVFTPSADWGPSDKVLFKSRNMFVPEIMTREFLYRQVRIHGYTKKENAVAKEIQVDNVVKKSSSEWTVWSAMTSN